MKRSKPLKPTAFKPRPPKDRTGTLSTTSFARTKASDEKPRKRLRPSRPKMTPIRRAARGQECQLQIPGVCNRNPETVVLCHSNALADGKGMGLKAPDTAAAFGCSACHDVLDGRAPRPEGITATFVDWLFRAGVTRTHEILAQMGLINNGKPSECESPGRLTENS